MLTTHHHPWYWENQAMVSNFDHTSRLPFVPQMKVWLWLRVSFIPLFVFRAFFLGIDTWNHLLLASIQSFWRLYLLLPPYSGMSIMVSTTTTRTLYASGTSSSWCSFHVSSTSEVVVAVFFLHHQQEGGGHLRYYLLCWKLQCRQQSKSGDERGWCWGSAPLLWPPALFHFPLPG